MGPEDFQNLQDLFIFITDEFNDAASWNMVVVQFAIHLQSLRLPKVSS